MEFKKGDKVDWFGSKGEVTTVRDHEYAIRVTFYDRSAIAQAFTLDGRYIAEQEPSLKLIERQKQNVKKTVELKRYLVELGDTIFFTNFTTLPLLAVGHRILKTETMAVEYEGEE